MKARLKITLKCNRFCPYCINKNKAYKDKWTPISNINDVKWSIFSSLIVSGGEPTLLPPKDLINILSCLRSLTQRPIYLQTNGDLLTKSLVKEIDNYIDGIGLSIHNLKEFKSLKTRFEDILKIKPIQLYIQDTMFFDNTTYLGKVMDKGFSFRIWKEGEFDTTEQIFVLNNKECINIRAK